jgi:hypothetical protein
MEKGQPYETCTQFNMTLTGDQLHYYVPYVRFGYIGGDVPFWGTHIAVRDLLQYMLADINAKEYTVKPIYK